MQQSLAPKVSSTSKALGTLSTHGSAASDGTFNHSDKTVGLPGSAVDTPVIDELLDLLIPTIECVDCLFRPDGCSTCAQSTATSVNHHDRHGRFANGREALMSFIGACFSGVPSYDVKKGIYTYYVNSPSSLRGYSTSPYIDDAESGLAVLNVAIRRIIGSDYCFNTERMETARMKKTGKIIERRRNINLYKLVIKSDLRLITISGFKSFNYLDSRLIAILTRGSRDGFHGFLWLAGTGKPSFITPPKDVIMCCDEEDFYERMTVVPVMGVTEAKLIRHFKSIGLTYIVGLEDLVGLLTAEAEGIKAKCLASFKKTHYWLYRDDAAYTTDTAAVNPDEIVAKNLLANRLSSGAASPNRSLVSFMAELVDTDYRLIKIQCD